MAVEVGQQVEGKVVSVRDFGAFVDLEDNQSGMIHISQVSNGYVKDINDFLAVGDVVKVKVIKILDDGKINLSMSALEEKKPEQAPRPPRVSQPAPVQRQEAASGDFDQMMSQFLKDSEDRLSSLRRNTEGKRGGRGGRRG